MEEIKQKLDLILDSQVVMQTEVIRLNSKIDRLDEKFEKKFEETNKRIDSLDEKFENKFNQLDEKFENKFNQLDEKFENKFNQLDEKFEKRFDILEESLEEDREEIGSIFNEIFKKLSA